MRAPLLSPWPTATLNWPRCFDGSDYGPPAIGPANRAPAAACCRYGYCRILLELLTTPNASALLDRAPLDLRVNALKTSRDAVAAEFSDAELLPQSPYALRLPTGQAVDNHPAVLDGRSKYRISAAS